MLKPNYWKKETNSNYKIWFGFGNGYFGETKSRGMIELTINGFTVRIIPAYDLDAYPFPPQTIDLEAIHELPRDFKNVSERRYYSFYYSDVVFFENNEKAGQFLNLDFRNNRNPKRGNECVVYFITSDTLKEISREIRRKMPHLPYTRNQKHPIRRNDIQDLMFIQFLDEKFAEIRDALIPEMRLRLEL